MSKDKNKVIEEFNEIVNMTHQELSNWLSTESSIKSGWKDNQSDETIGHSSGKKIVEILKSNPGKDPNKYSSEDIEHMTKVVSYCKRHLAQEGQSKKNTNSKSYKSLKNWGHDAQK